MNDTWTVFKVDSPIKKIQESISEVLHGAHHRLTSPQSTKKANEHATATGRKKSVDKNPPRSRPKAVTEKDGQRWLVEREKAKLEIWAAGELSEAQGRLQSELHRKVLRLIDERDQAREKAVSLKSELMRAREEIDARIREAEEREKEVNECYEHCYKAAESSYRVMIDQVASSLEAEAKAKLKSVISSSAAITSKSKQIKPVVTTAKRDH